MSGPLVMAVAVLIEAGLVLLTVFALGLKRVFSRDG